MGVLLLRLFEALMKKFLVFWLIFLTDFYSQLAGKFQGYWRKQISFLIYLKVFYMASFN